MTFYIFCICKVQFSCWQNNNFPCQESGPKLGPDGSGDLCAVRDEKVVVVVVVVWWWCGVVSDILVISLSSVLTWLPQ